jgi:hypothetical protein
MTRYRPWCFAAVALSCMPACAHAQSLFSQQKPAEVATQARADLEAASATIALERQKAVDAQAAQAAAGNAAAVAELAKAIAFYDKAAAVTQKAMAVTKAAINADGSVNPEGTLLTLGGVLPFPFNLVVMLGGPLVFREVSSYRRRREAAAALEAARKAAAENEAAGRSIVNSIDLMRVNSPLIASEMARLAASTQTNPASVLTPVAARIVAGERLT